MSECRAVNYGCICALTCLRSYINLTFVVESIGYGRYRAAFEFHHTVFTYYHVTTNSAFCICGKYDIFTISLSYSHITTYGKAFLDLHTYAAIVILDINIACYGHYFFNIESTTCSSFMIYGQIRNRQSIMSDNKTTGNNTQFTN